MFSVFKNYLIKLKIYFVCYKLLEMSRNNGLHRVLSEASIQSNLDDSLSSPRVMHERPGHAGSMTKDERRSKMAEAFKTIIEVCNASFNDLKLLLILCRYVIVCW